MEKDEYAIVLDFLPYGYPMSGKMQPVAQAVGEKTLIVLEIIPRRGMTLETKEKVYIGSGKRDKVYFIAGRVAPEKVTEAAKIQLNDFLGEFVANNEQRFVEFYNKAPAINTRLHQIELLPGFGQKHLHELLKSREEKPFASFADMRERLSSLPDPKKAIEKRIVEELLTKPRFKLFVK